MARLAYRYYSLARNDPATKTDLVAARDLFEQYFAMPEVKALPENHANRRAYSRVAGDVWYRIAEQSTGDDAKKAYQKALQFDPNYGPARSAPACAMSSCGWFSTSIATWSPGRSPTLR